MFDVRLIIISLKCIQKNPFQIKKNPHNTDGTKGERFFFLLISANKGCLHIIVTKMAISQEQPSVI